ncbi:MAG: VOC family protein [Jiangellaceae bacterium]
MPAGYHSLTPYLAVAHAARAIDFYRTAFGAEQISRMDSPDGGVMFAVLRIGDSNFELGEPSPEFGTVAPNGQGVSSSVMIYCADVDAMFDGALEAGAAVVTPLTDLPSGDRYGTVDDAFGHRWSIATRIG